MHPSLRFMPLAGALLLTPSLAQADILQFYVAPKAEYVNGSGEVYEKFKNTFGYGAEAGVELLGIDLWADLLVMGDQQFLSTLNLGFDATFGDDVRFTIGTYVGPIFYVFEEQEADTFNPTQDQRDVLNAAGFDDARISSIQQDYNRLSEEASDVDRLSVGLNLPRVRLGIDFKLAPFLYFGFQASAGYHWVLNGEDVVAGAKSKAIDDLVREQGLDPDQADVIREMFDAREVDTEKLDGFNYSAGTFLKFEL